MNVSVNGKDTIFDPIVSKGEPFRVEVRELSKPLIIAHLSNNTYDVIKKPTGCYLGIKRDEKIIGPGDNIALILHAEQNNWFYELTRSENDLRKYARFILGTKEDLERGIPLFILILLVTVFLLILLPIEKARMIILIFALFIPLILRFLGQRLWALEPIYLAIAIYLIYLYRKEILKEFRTLLKTKLLLKKRIKNTGFLYITGMVVCIIIFLSFGVHHLGKFETVDEPKWLNDDGRVEQLYAGIAFKPWLTIINDKPGIIPSYLSGMYASWKSINDFDYSTVEKYFFWSRLPIIIFNAVMLAIIFFIMSVVFSRAIALTTIFFISTHPLLIGMSQVVNPDATLWSLGFCAILGYLAYLKTKNTNYIWFSGIFLGLASLSKYFANFIFYFLFVICILYAYEKVKQNRKEFLIKEYGAVIRIWLIAFATMIILFPALWIYPPAVMTQTILHYFVAPLSFFLILVIIDHSTNLGMSKYYEKWKVHLQKMVPLATLLLFAFLIINILSRYKIVSMDFINRGEQSFVLFMQSITGLILSEPEIILILLMGFLIYKVYNKFNYAEMALLLIILLFFIGAIAVGQYPGRRYTALLTPLYLTLSAIVSVKIITHAKPFLLKLAISIGIIILSLAAIMQAAPFYYNYTNNLNHEGQVVFDAWGMGGYELAQMINELPNAENLTIWTDREGFSVFFAGQSYWRGRSNPFDHDIDYLILTNRGLRIFETALENYHLERGYLYATVAGETPLLEYYQKEPEFKFCVSKNNCVRAVRVDIT